MPNLCISLGVMYSIFSKYETFPATKSLKPVIDSTNSVCPFP